MSDDTTGDDKRIEPDEPGEAGEAGGRESLRDVVEDAGRSWWTRRSTLMVMFVVIALGFALVAAAPTLIGRLGGGDPQAGAQESPPALASVPAATSSGDASDPSEPGAAPSGAGASGRIADEPGRSSGEGSGDGERDGGAGGSAGGDRDGDSSGDGAGSGGGDSGDGGGGSGGSEDSGDPDPATNSVPASVPISGGQERVWDPCGLIRPALSSLGDARLNADPHGELARCDVEVGSDTVEVTLWRDFGEDPSGTPSSVGSATLYDGDCENQIVPAGGDYRFDVEAENSEACSAVDTVARKAASVVGDGTIPTRRAPGSLYTRSACDLPSSSALRTALTVDDIPGPSRRFAEWDCEWDGDDDRFLRVIFQRDDAGSDGDRQTYSGRTAYVRGDAWGEGCLVDVVARSYASPDGDGQVHDLARVHLRGTDDCDDAVTAAKSVAAAL
ncbi:hypothetical protein [Myceligenerans crystallogenes]|uniref:Uncharacterized protein n=1 Tax=Myceligenerans crystallogenes TaxID=316335 RepID=A0ABP4ZJR2_9MICO